MAINDKDVGALAAIFLQWVDKILQVKLSEITDTALGVPGCGSFLQSTLTLDMFGRLN